VKDVDFMSFEENNGTAIQHRSAGNQPRRNWQSWLIGHPLQTADAPHQTIGKFIGLAVFASDALSSTAYGPQEMMVILAVAGSGAFVNVVPITIAIVILLTILTFSYQQTIHAYPGGGGAYIVSRDNLGEVPAQVAGASLLMDYILTVAVSVSSGVAQIVSAYPGLGQFRVGITVGLVIFIMVINLRGVKESGRAFAVPTYFFLVMVFLTLGVGFFKLATGSLGAVVDPPQDLVAAVAQPMTLFLLLRAFASGTTALTGVEAISNGITAFKKPASKNAGITLLWMAIILGSSLLGISFIAQHIGALPSEQETVISQLARTAFDSRGILYLGMITSTTVILVMAANTAFADFPRLSAIQATDGFLPRQLAFRGSRLVYSRGIVALATIASLLIIYFDASVTRLIPLYAIGVFLSFTLSQTGMARRWWKSGHLPAGTEIKERGSTLVHDPRWNYKMVINGIGAVMTAVVAVIFAATKFSEGAYVVIIIIPTLVVIFLLIRKHYIGVARALSLDKYGAPPRNQRHRVILLISGVHRGTLAALRYARSLSDDITAVHISIDPEETARIEKKWETWGDGYRLVILESPYRTFIEPLLGYIDELDDQRQPNELITVIVPQFVSRKIWTGALHSRTAETLRKILLNRSHVVVTEVPYQVD
jgi:amino acid transporter